MRATCLLSILPSHADGGRKGWLESERSSFYLISTHRKVTFDEKAFFALTEKSITKCGLIKYRVTFMKYGRKDSHDISQFVRCFGMALMYVGREKSFESFSRNFVGVKYREKNGNNRK